MSEAIANTQGDAGHPVNNVVDKKIILGKQEGREGGKTQGVSAPPPKKKEKKKEFVFFSPK
jgi:hypothetical protein